MKDLTDFSKYNMFSASLKAVANVFFIFIVDLYSPTYLRRTFIELYSKIIQKKSEERENFKTFLSGIWTQRRLRLQKLTEKLFGWKIILYDCSLDDKCDLKSLKDKNFWKKFFNRKS